MVDDTHSLSGATGSQWDQFYNEITRREPDACLNPDAWAPETGHGDLLTVFLRIGLVGSVTAGCMWWQWQHIEDDPMVPLIADLEGPDRKVNCLIFSLINPNPRVLGIRMPIPGFPDRPTEFMKTGMWQTFLFTWPYSPRYFEPLLTETARVTIAMLVLALQLVLFAILGKANASVTAVVSDGGISLSTVLAICSIYTVSIVGVLLKEIMILLYARAFQRQATTAKVVCAAVSVFLGTVLLGMTRSLTHFSCSEFAGHVVLPFLAKQPLALIGVPVIYAFRNSFGGGPGVDGILRDFRKIDELETAQELCHALRQHGRGADLKWLPQWWGNKSGKSLMAALLASGDEGQMRSLDEMRYELKRTTYIASSTPELRALHARFDKEQLMSDHPVELLREVKKWRQFIRGMSTTPDWRLTLAQLDELLERLPPDDDGDEDVEQQNGVGSVELSAKEMNDLHILLREATWNYFMGRREYYANRRAAIAAGEWYEDVPGTAVESVFSGWFKKVRAGGEQARENGGKDKRGAAESEWTDNPAKMTTSQDGEQGVVKI